MADANQRITPLVPLTDPPAGAGADATSDSVLLPRCSPHRPRFERLRRMHAALEDSVLGDIVGAACLFTILFIGLFAVGVYQ